MALEHQDGLVIRWSFPASAPDLSGAFLANHITKIAEEAPAFRRGEESGPQA